MKSDTMESFTKENGFFWPAAEIYGGVAGFYDYGHIGALLKKRFENAWLSFFVDNIENAYLLDGAFVLPEKPLIASGHVKLFNDIIVSCQKCKTYYRADILLGDLGVRIEEGAQADEVNKICDEKQVKCPKCSGKVYDAKPFNLMFELGVGPDKSQKSYLRPETAQTSYLNFKREFNLLRRKLPLGLAIIGKAYRNEIAPRQGLYRLRELTQAELQYFFDPETFDKKIPEKMLNRVINVTRDSKKEVESMSISQFIKEFNVPSFYAYYLCYVHIFYTEVLKFPKEKLRFLEKAGVNRSFYNKVHFDIEADIESWGGFKEIGGMHYRGDYDLTSHSNGSGEDLSVNFNGKKVLPHVLEMSFGVDRNVWSLVDLLYDKEGEREYLKFPGYIAPFSAAVFPLQNDEKLVEQAHSIYDALKGRVKSFYDETASIGKRYARQDVIGTKYCITVDFDTINKESENFGTVTVRERDSKNQQRIKIDELVGFVVNGTDLIPSKFV